MQIKRKKIDPVAALFESAAEEALCLFSVELRSCLAKKKLVKRKKKRNKNISSLSAVSSEILENSSEVQGT